MIAFNRSEVSETDIELIMESIADCLFSVFVTLGMYWLNGYSNILINVIYKKPLINKSLI